MSDTPRTDESVDNCAYYQAQCDMVEAEFARKLERELDEARAELSNVYRWIERNHPDGFIDSRSHFQNLERVTKHIHDKMDKLERERDDTPWHSNGETKDEWFARQREKYIVLKCERNKALQQSEIWAKQVSEAIRQVEASDALYRKQCGQLEAMREVLRTIREESAKIFSATAGLPDCGLIHRVAAASAVCVNRYCEMK